MHQVISHLDNPFADRPDPGFLWLGPNQAEALSVLRRGILAGQGFVLLTGDAGTGKTTLVNALIAGFPKDVAWAVIGDPGPTRLEFYLALARGFGIDRQFSSKVQFLLQFSAFLQSTREAGKKTVLLVDDCHRLNQDLLEELRLLAGIARDGIGLIDICFIGRREFLDLLQQPNNRPVAQRLTGRVELLPLCPDETGEYIRHRLRVAGIEEEVFAAEAVQLIHRAAAGNPRLINLICEKALQDGSAPENGQIDRAAIEQGLAQLNLPGGAPSEYTGPAGEAGHLRRLRHRLSVLLPDGRRWRWVKYGLGVVLVGGLCLSLLLPGKNGGDTGSDAGSPAVQQPAPRDKVRPELSPGVTKLEPIGKAIELDMPDRGATMAKKKEEAKQAGDRTGEISAEPKPPAASGSDEGDGPGGEKVGLPPEPLAEQAKAGPVEEAAPVPPMQPGRVVLPLQANGLELTEQAVKEFGKFLAELKKHPDAKLLVKGFVSAKTNSPGNIRLSEERALAVQKLLVQSGIDAARITVKGMGNQEPLAGNDTREGRTRNRRVEIEVVDR